MLFNLYTVLSATFAFIILQNIIFIQMKYVI